MLTVAAAHVFGMKLLFHQQQKLLKKSVQKSIMYNHVQFGGIKPQKCVKKIATFLADFKTTFCLHRHVAAGH